MIKNIQQQGIEQDIQENWQTILYLMTKNYNV